MNKRSNLNLPLFIYRKLKTNSDDAWKNIENEDYKIVIPLENSLAGRVADIHYLLPKYKLQIHAEHFQKVEHNLLARENTKLEDIKYVRSHSQAIGQCQKIIMENKYKTIISTDTSTVQLNLPS